MDGEFVLQSVLLLVAGLALVGLSIWRRRGRSGGRAWARWQGSRQAWLFFLPGFGLILIAAGVVLIGEAANVMAVMIFGSLILLVGGVISLWGGFFIPPPMWFLPSWLRPIVATERAERHQLRENRRRRRRERSQKSSGVDGAPEEYRTRAQDDAQED